MLINVQDLRALCELERAKEVMDMVQRHIGESVSNSFSVFTQ